MDVKRKSLDFDQSIQESPLLNKQEDSPLAQTLIARPNTDLAAFNADFDIERPSEAEAR